MNEVLQTATMITTLFVHLGVLHSSCKMHRELLSNSVDTIGILALHFFVTFLYSPLSGVLSTQWVF